MMSRRTHRVLYSISCVKCSSVYIGQTGRSLKQYMWQSTLPSTEEWGRTSKHLPWQSMSSRLDMQLTSSSLRYSHQHTTTRCMLESWHIQPNHAGGLEQGARNRYWKCIRRSWTDGMYPFITLFSFLFFLTVHCFCEYSK